MKFRVMGQNRETGARATMEFEAESKATAERKATQAGMSVHRVEDISDGSAPKAGIVAGGTGGARTGVHPLIKLLAVVIVLAAVIYFLWPRLRHLLGR